MSERKLDPERGSIVAARLRELGVRGVLITAAEGGYIVDLACAIDECLCPSELGGVEYFQEVRPDLPDWMPTADHFPVLKEQGGHRTVDNVRLAHRLCNRLDYSKRIGRPYASDLARVEAARIAATRAPHEERVWAVLVWNMGLGSPGDRKPRENWNRLSEVMEEHAIDVALVNEVSTDLLAGLEGALYDGEGREAGTESVESGVRRSFRHAGARGSVTLKPCRTADANRRCHSRTRARDRGLPGSCRCPGSATSRAYPSTGSCRPEERACEGGRGRGVRGSRRPLLLETQEPGDAEPHQQGPHPCPSTRA